MRRHPKAIVGASVLLVAALVAAGCSDGDDVPSASNVEPTEIPANATKIPTEEAVLTEEAAPTPVAPMPTESPSEEPAPAAVQPEARASIFQDCGQVYLCAELEVPADHNDPDSGTITLELGMLPAGDPDRRIGVLLVNPGGPGGDMNSFLEYGAGLSDQLLARFDVVGWNPRGVMGSVPHGCREEAEHLMLLDPIPDTDEEEAALDDAARETAEACLDGLGENVHLIGTDQTVADIDHIRQALGEEQISYFGFSYGSLLGLLYADRYGPNARAVVVDGVVDPALDSEELSVAQIRGFVRVIQDLFDACREDEACPVPGDPASAYDQLAEQVEDAPLLDADENMVLGPAEVVLSLVTVAYAPDAWTFFYQGMASALEGDGEMLQRLAHFYLESTDSGSFISIGCTDAGRITRAELERLIQRLGDEAGAFGRSSASSARPCVYWADTVPLPVGPVRAPDAASVLVIGNRGDNATPYEWAVAVAEALETGVLLTYNGQGHTSYGRHPCVDEVADNYLIDLVLSSEDIECG